MIIVKRSAPTRRCNFLPLWAAFSIQTRIQRAAGLLFMLRDPQGRRKNGFCLAKRKFAHQPAGWAGGRTFYLSRYKVKSWESAARCWEEKMLRARFDLLHALPFFGTPRRDALMRRGGCARADRPLFFTPNFVRVASHPLGPPVTSKDETLT